MEENTIINEETCEESYKEERRLCRYCQRELNTNFDFCIYCGKSQKDTGVPALKQEPEKKKTASVVKPKKKRNAVSAVLISFSVFSFFLALIFFINGLLSWAGLGAVSASAGGVFGNVFGGNDVSSYIVCLINTFSSFFVTIIFMLAGMTLLFARKR